MALNFIISGTAPRAGKTMVGCALAFAFKMRAMHVGVMKPVQTGCVEREGALVPEDAAALLAAASSDYPLGLVCPYRYRSPLAPAAAAEIDKAPLPDISEIERAYRLIAASSDVMIVEDAAGLGAPIDWQHTYADLARMLGLELILVVPNHPGFISAAALSLDYAARRGIPIRGCIVNGIDRAASEAVQRDAEFLERATGTRILGTVRFREPLALNIVERLL
jgi:dethiobiotin synthetase